MNRIVAFSMTALLVAQVRARGDFDVVVYGGTSGGVTSAVQAARMGKHVALVVPGKHLRGMTSGGLGWTDMARPEIVGGLSREFYQGIYRHYQDETAWKYDKRSTFVDAPGQHARAIDEKAGAMWVFEPHVAEKVFNEMVREAGVMVFLDQRLDRKDGVVKDGPRITSIRSEAGETFAAKVFIDATYEGDLMASAGVKWTFGREANGVYGETINGIQTARATKNQLPAGIDPYVVKDEAASGLLVGVRKDAGGSDGIGDDRIQAYCYRMCLTDVPENRVMIEKPAGYNEALYELLFRAIEAGQTDKFFKLDLMPNRKTDSNNASGISTDLIVDQSVHHFRSDYTFRDTWTKFHEEWQRGFVWTIQNHPRVPKAIREKYAKWGLPKDEFVDTGHWPHQLYVREARRMVSDVIITERAVVEDTAKRAIALGGYSMDSHNVQRYVDANGHVRNEGDVQVKVDRPYRIDYGCIVPQERECTNLFVTFCVSASHAAFSTIRMEPVFMELGECAGTASSLAIDGGTSVQKVPYEALRKRLLEDGAVLEWPVPVKFTIDASSAADLKAWADETLLPVCEQWYPQIVAMLPSDGFEAPRQITITFRDDMKGTPAMASGDRVSCNAAWFRTNLKGEAAGAVVHELVHVVQSYRGRRNPGWLVEGLADYIRWFKYEPQKRGAEIRDPAKAKYDASYRVTANFLNWVVQQHGEDVIIKLNAAMRRGKYGEELWKELTGKPIAQLGEEWKQSLLDSKVK